ncbi:MAG: hypothetical protein LW807_05180 [Proteobacteria bacterium]|jgi:hypothetical protein|nr:hypothetical protein [Pseudomonadota bacterium]
MLSTCSTRYKIPEFTNNVNNLIECKNQSTYNNPDNNIMNLLNTLKKNEVLSYADVKNIENGKFGKNPGILIKLLETLSTMRIEFKTKSLIVQTLANAIFKGVFGKDKDVLVKLASFFVALNPHETIFYRLIVRALENNTFGNNSDVLEAIIMSFSKIDFTPPEYQVRVIKYMLKNNNLLKLNKVNLIISNWTIEKAQYNEILALLKQYKLNNEEHIQFGAFSNLNECVKKNVNGVNIEDCLEHFGSYGITYNKDYKPELLVVYKDTENNPIGFKDFFNRDINHIINQHKLSNIKVYNFVESISGLYPAQIDDLSAHSIYFNSFPTWLQNKIKLNHFNINAYVSADILKFVINDLLSSVPFTTSNTKEQCKHIIQEIIKIKGKRFDISTNQIENTKFKDQINQEFNAIENLVTYKVLLGKFWLTIKNNEEKLKLCFLLGQLAKDGALGYHNNKSNQANDAFYGLFEHCISKIINDGNSHPELLKIQDLAKTGACIEILSNDLLIKVNPNVLSVWDTIE